MRKMCPNFLNKTLPVFPVTSSGFQIAAEAGKIAVYITDLELPKIFADHRGERYRQKSPIGADDEMHMHAFTVVLQFIATCCGALMENPQLQVIKKPLQAFSIANSSALSIHNDVKIIL